MTISDRHESTTQAGAVASRHYEQIPAGLGGSATTIERVGGAAPKGRRHDLNAGVVQLARRSDLVCQ